PRHDLDARGNRVAELHRRLHDVVEDAVDAVPDAQLFLVRLDVNVARAFLDGRQQNHVHQLDDRRVLARRREVVGADLLDILDDLDVVFFGRNLLERLGRRFERRCGRRGTGTVTGSRGLAVILQNRGDNGRL